ncbi:hypothetical protein TL18_08515 [Methanobrevibacter sp. YE315]|uniref:hypothetical protein n=1 Tax=Methanobrevibacter sp. YE315 TaxID=1609968 RepID=UPI000764F2B0|nr:hypothetical protein [Methanobrevibacter sp. YE315]AMD18058.1 hypothetical protein TL18_08515 [Methanobrevibacter sp. YE315]
MIFNKTLSIFISACFFMLLMLIISSITAMFFNGGSIPYIGLVFVVIFYFIARAFYNYLRNDDYYTNTRNHSSDKPGESYIMKGERDNKKMFVVVWVIFILILAAISLWLYSFNKGLV